MDTHGFQILPDLLTPEACDALVPAVRVVGRAHGRPTFGDPRRLTLEDPGRKNAAVASACAALESKVDCGDGRTPHWLLIGAAGPCDRQPDHRDHVPVENGAAPLICIVALCDDTTLDVRPLRARRTRVVSIPKGSGMLFRADLVHAGSSYRAENWRLHCELLLSHHKMGIYVDEDEPYDWLTLVTGVYYTQSTVALGGGVRPDYIIDMGYANLRRLTRRFPGSTIVVYYGQGVPEDFLDRVRALKGIVMVFCDVEDLRAPMLGRIAELDVRRTEWTVTFDVHDDVRHRKMKPVLDYISALPRDAPTHPIRCASWKVSTSTFGEPAYIRHMKAEWDGDDIVDAAGFMVHQSAPTVPVEPFCTLGRTYQYGDDEIVLLRWLARLDADCVDHGAAKFAEVDLSMSRLAILDKSPASDPRAYADEVWTL